MAKKKKSFYRIIWVGSVAYQYRIGSGYVKIRGYPPIDLSTFTGISWDQIEKGKWKKWFSITPSDIKEFIEKKIQIKSS